MPDRLGNRQDRLLPDQRLAQDAREEPGRGLVRSPRTDADGGQPDPDAVDEAAPGVVGQQQLPDRLLGAVAGERRVLEVLGDGVGQRRAVDRDRGREDQPGVVAAGACATRMASSSARVPSRLTRVALLEVRLGLTGHHGCEVEDQIGLARHQTLGLARRRQVGDDRLDLSSGAGRRLRRNHIGQGHPFDGAATDVPVRHQPGGQLAADHPGRTQDQDVQRNPPSGASDVEADLGHVTVVHHAVRTLASLTLGPASAVTRRQNTAVPFLSPILSSVGLMTLSKAARSQLKEE